MVDLQLKKHRHPAVRDRINAVNSKLKDTNGNRHIFVSNSCKYIIKDYKDKRTRKIQIFLTKKMDLTI